MPIAVNNHQKLQNLQKLWLGMGAVNLLLFYFMPQPNQSGVVNLVGAAWFVFLFTRIGKWTVPQLSNAALACGALLLLHVSVHSGGMNSPSNLWFGLLPVLALTVMGQRAGWVWLGICMLILLGLLVATQAGWVANRVEEQGQFHIWAYGLAVGLLLTLHFIINVYHRISQQQVQTMNQRKAELEKKQKELQQSQSHKDEFIASMGHELRTPMTAILGLNGVLQAQLQDRPEDQQLAEQIRSSTELLLNLVNQILLLSQLEADRVVLHPQTTDLHRLLHAMQRRWASLAQKKALALEFVGIESVPQWFAIDAQRFEQILATLLDNAVKFTRSGGITVRVQHSQEQLIVTVLDTGPGIAQDKLATIFDRFEQADDSTHRIYGGTGIGLAIAKRLVDLHQGRLQVSSSPGQGSCFAFNLPLQACTSPAQPDHPLPPPLALGDVRVLVVDDNQVNLRLIEMTLHQLWPHCFVHGLSSGQQALQWLAEHRVDVVLLDKMMPGMDGLQTAQHIRASQDKALATVPILGLTAFEDDTEFAQCLQAGMDAVASKPIAGEALRKMMTRVLHERRGPSAQAEGSA